MKRIWNFAGVKPTWWASVLLIVMLGLAACQQAAAPTQSVPVTSPTSAPTVAAMPTATTAAAAPAAAEPMINVATDAKLGKILVDGKGMTLYMFTKDAADKSNCSGGCLKAWPPLTTTGSAKAGDGVDQSMIGTTAATDGSKMVTYNHMPLYYFASDAKAGDTAGQKVGGVWFVVGPDGKPIGMDSAPAASGSGSTAGAVTVNVATDPKLGKILVDGKGMTLYMYEKDEPDKSNCSGGCLKAWPPLVAAGNVTAGDGVDKSMFGSAALADGSKIVTYNHMPLYYYVKDTKAGDVTGEDVGSVWYVVSPDGKKVEPEGSSSSSGSSAAASGVTVAVASNANLGKILVDGQGKTLYIFTKDTPDKSNCAGGCLKAWPPLVATGDVKAGDGVDKSMIGSATLADGSKIVTYNHMPLYYFASDAKAGDTAGQGVGGVWYVISPDGKPVGESGTGY